MNDSADIESDATPIEESSKFVGKFGKNADVCVFGRKKALSVTNAQSLESLPLICHNVTLLVLDCNSTQVLPVNREALFNYDNKAPP